jgi:hypothetical protein
MNLNNEMLQLVNLQNLMDGTVTPKVFVSKGGSQMFNSEFAELVRQSRYLGDDYMGAKLAAENNFAADVDLDSFLNGSADQVRTLMQREKTDIIAIGGVLAQVHGVLSKHGGKPGESKWGAWLKEVGVSVKQSQHYLSVFARYGPSGTRVPLARAINTAGIGVARELAKPSANPATVAKLEERLVAGEKLTHKAVVAELAAGKKPSLHIIPKLGAVARVSALKTDGLTLEAVLAAVEEVWGVSVQLVPAAGAKAA